MARACVMVCGKQRGKQRERKLVMVCEKQGACNGLYAASNGFCGL
jgi:hypothetical protein